MEYRLSSLLATNNYIPVNKILVMKLGPLEAMMFGELCSESDYWHEHNGITEDGYFFSTVDNIENKLNIKRKLQEKIVKSLASAGLLSVSKRGMPAKRYIKINEEKLVNLLVPKGLTSTDHSSQQVRTIGPTNNTISNKNIENNISTTRPPTSLSKGKKSSDFSPPTLEEVKKYIKEKEYNIDAEYFFNYYSADGWKDRNNKPIKNWKLKAFTWHNKSSKSSQPIIEETQVENIVDEGFWLEARKKQEEYLQQMRERRLNGGTNS